MAHHTVTAEQLYSLDSVGIAIARRAVSQEAVAHLNAVIDRCLGGARIAKFSILELDAAFMELMAHPWILSACSEVLGPSFRFDHAFGLEQPDASPNLHGGPEACQGSCFYRGRLSPRGGASVGRVSVGVCLTDQTPETGGFAYIPGSHNSSYLRHGSNVLAEFLNNDFTHDSIQVPRLSSGDVCLFSDCLVHGTSPWHGTYTRRHLYYMYSPGYMAWRPYEEIAKYRQFATSDIQRRLLRPPYVAQIPEQGTAWGANQWRTSTL